MASAHKYSWVRKDGSVGRGWRAKYSTPDGVRSRRGFDRKSDAVKYAEDREAEARHGVSLGEQYTPPSRVTVEQWCKTWLERQYVRPNTVEHYRAATRRITDGLGARPVSALREDELKGWRRTLTDTYQPSTIERTWSVLGTLLRAAVKEGLIRESPFAPMAREAAPALTLDELLTDAQIRAWGEAMPLVCREMPLVASMTGLRQGELLGLRLPSVDFLRREIRVVEQLQTIGAGVPVIVPPKTRSSVRTVPLPRLAGEALARHLERFPAVEGEPIFRGQRGQRWRRGTFGEVWREAKKDAGLPEWAHWHGLRDSYASGVIRSGLDPLTLTALMGHSSLAQAKPYLKLYDGTMDRARRALDDLADEGHSGVTGRSHVL